MEIQFGYQVKSLRSLGLDKTHITYQLDQTANTIGTDDHYITLFFSLKSDLRI